MDWERARYSPEYWDYTKAMGFRWPNEAHNDLVHSVFRKFGDFSKHSKRRASGDVI